jgi:hypothetical protein
MAIRGTFGTERSDALVSVKPSSVVGIVVPPLERPSEAFGNGEAMVALPPPGTSDWAPHPWYPALPTPVSTPNAT